MRQRIARFEKQRKRRKETNLEEQVARAAQRANEATNPHLPPGAGFSSDVRELGAEAKKLMKSDDCAENAFSIDRRREQGRAWEDKHAVVGNDGLKVMTEFKEECRSTRRRPLECNSPEKPKSSMRLMAWDSSDSDDDLIALFQKKPPQNEDENRASKGENTSSQKHSFPTADGRNSVESDRAEGTSKDVIDNLQDATKVVVSKKDNFRAERTRNGRFSKAEHRGGNVHEMKTQRETVAFASAADEEDLHVRKAIALSLKVTREETKKRTAASEPPSSLQDIICIGDSEDESTESNFSDQSATRRRCRIPEEVIEWASNHCALLGINKISRSPAMPCTSTERKKTTLAASTALPASTEGNTISMKENESTHLCFMDRTTLVDTHPRISACGGWIWAHDPLYGHCHRDRSVGDVESFEREWSLFAKQLSGQTPAKHEEVLSLAERHGVLSGKWLLRVSADFAPELWPKIRDGVLDGKLGPTAKISHNVEPLESMLIVCIYVPDFRDKAEVLRVRRAIHYDTKVFTKTCLYFKPDCFTYIDPYLLRWKRFRKSIYSCGGESKSHKDLECSTLLVNGARCTGRKGCPRCYPSCLKLRKG